MTDKIPVFLGTDAFGDSDDAVVLAAAEFNEKGELTLTVSPDSLLGHVPQLFEMSQIRSLALNLAYYAPSTKKEK
jgi:hypothetical protein